MFSRCRDRRRGLGQGCTCCPAGCAPGRDGKWLPQPCAVPGNVRRTGLNQITGLLCLQASCVSLKGRRKFFALNRAGNRELCVSCTCNFYVFFLILCKRLTLLLVAGVLCKDLCLLVVAKGDVWRCVLRGLLLAFWSCCSPAAGAVAGGPRSPHVQRAPLGSSCGVPRVGLGGRECWVLGPRGFPGDFPGVWVSCG